jgi:hypothetical protein
VHNSLSIPDLVEGPVFTALSMEATDEGGLPIVGAKLPGRAATDEASSWFGNVYEMGRSSDEQGKEHFTLFLRPFTDAQNRRHLLKTSSSPVGLPEVLIDPIGQPWAQANLGLVFKLLDEDLRRALSQQVAGAPGLVGTPSDYGDTFQMLPASIAPSALTLTAPAPSGGPANPVVPASASAAGGPPAPAAPPTVTARRRAPAGPTTTTMTTTTKDEPAPEPVGAASGAPPPPGMKPPQRAPGTS